MSAICVSQNVDELKSAVKNSKLFSTSLKTSTLLMIFEILWNIGKEKSKCKDCFSKKTLHGLKKFKVMIQYFVRKDVSIEKRKKKFLKAPSSFRKLIRRLVKDFLRNCCTKEQTND